MGKNSFIYKDVDFTGKRFGKLTVIKKADIGRSWWVCQCDCGKVVTLIANKMVTYRSCGCGEKYNRNHLGENNITHGKTETRLYRVWCKMKERCNNPNIEHYPDGRPMRGYSRDGKEEYKEQLMDMMDNAPDEQTRQSIQRMIDQMQ